MIVCAPSRVVKVSEIERFELTSRVFHPDMPSHTRVYRDYLIREQDDLFLSHVVRDIPDRPRCHYSAKNTGQNGTSREVITRSGSVDSLHQKGAGSIGGKRSEEVDGSVTY